MKYIIDDHGKIVYSCFPMINLGLFILDSTTTDIYKHFNFYKNGKFVGVFIQKYIDVL